MIQCNQRFGVSIRNSKFLSLISDGIIEKVLSDIDEDLSALVIIAFHVGILFQWSMNKDDIDGKAYVNMFKKIMLKGLMI